MHGSGMEAMSGTADHELDDALASAAAGDDVAFARIVAVHHGEMHRVCAFVCRDQAMAEDAVQAAWPLAWLKLSSVIGWDADDADGRQPAYGAYS